MILFQQVVKSVHVYKRLCKLLMIINFHFCAGGIWYFFGSGGGGPFAGAFASTGATFNGGGGGAGALDFIGGFGVTYY